jgi:6-phosphofructokinase
VPQINILIADNDPDQLNSLVKDVFELSNFVVFPAETITRARELLRQEFIHLAILDIRLNDDNDPYDDSGLDICTEIDPLIPTILYTAYPPENGLQKTFPNKLKLLHKDQFLELYLVDKHQGPDTLLKATIALLKENYEYIPCQRIGVLTSGGDSPGMNAAIWSIVRTAAANHIEVIGIEDGYRGLVNNQMYKLSRKDMGNIIGESGTILGTTRYDGFFNPEARRQAVELLFNKHISGLIVIGGDGSIKGAQELTNSAQEHGIRFRTVAIPGTIDNDVWGTDMTLGAATAADAIIDVLRSMVKPAQALHRIFVCEVMGRYSGFLALQAAIGIGANAVILPEKVISVYDHLPRQTTDRWVDRVSYVDTEKNLQNLLEAAATRILEHCKWGKDSGFIVVGEGISLLTENRSVHLNGQYICQHLEDRIKSWDLPNPPDVRAHIVGFPIRGMPPSNYDVWLGVLFGREAVKNLMQEGQNRENVLLGWSDQAQQVISTPYQKVIDMSERPPSEIWNDRERWRQILEEYEAVTDPFPSLDL